VRFPGTGGSGGSEGKLFTERLDLGRVVVIRPYWDLAEHSCHDAFLQTLSCTGKGVCSIFLSVDRSIN
jgi:hypothetical protein